MKKTLITYTLLGILAAGTLGPVVASAQQNSPATPRQAQTRDASLNGSVPVPEDQNLSEADELARYQSLTTVTLDEAVAAAQGATGLNDAPTQVELGDENSFLIWEVVIGNREVKIDAGNGQVLQTEQVGAKDEGDDDEDGEEGENETDEDRGEDENEAGEEGTENSG